MEGVDHVHVVQVRRGGLVGEVDRVPQGQVPDGEGLIFGVARLDAALVLMIELGEADGHLAAARTGRGDDDERAVRLDELVAAVALIADDAGDVVGIALDGIVAVDLQPERLELGLEDLGGGLAAEAGQDDAAHAEAEAAEGVDQPQRVGAVGDAQVAADLALLDVHGGDGHDDLDLVAQLHEHADLRVGMEAGQDPGGVVVVEELAAELQVELAAELADPGADVLGLHLQVFLVIEPQFFDHPSSPSL